MLVRKVKVLISDLVIKTRTNNGSDIHFSFNNYFCTQFGKFQLNSFLTTLLLYAVF